MPLLEVCLFKKCKKHNQIFFWQTRYKSLYGTNIPSIFLQLLTNKTKRKNSHQDMCKEEYLHVNLLNRKFYIVIGHLLTIYFGSQLSDSRAFAKFISLLYFVYNTIYPYGSISFVFILCLFKPTTYIFLAKKQTLYHFWTEIFVKKHSNSKIILYNYQVASASN